MATNRVLPKHFFDYFREKKTERCLSRLVCSADGVGTSANEKRALWPRRNEAAAVRNRQKNKPAVTLWVALNQRSAAPSGRVTDPMSWFISFRVGGCLLFCCSFEFIRSYIFWLIFFVGVPDACGHSLGPSWHERPTRPPISLAALHSLQPLRVAVDPIKKYSPQNSSWLSFQAGAKTL